MRENFRGIDYSELAVLIPDLFEAQVARTPEAVAVSFQGRSLTYRQLNQRANRLAYHLQKVGVGPEVLVGLCLDRSLEMIVGVLGILKAGGAYVPLDPNDPPERLAFMLEDARLFVLVTERRFLQCLPARAASAVFLDTDLGAIAQEELDNPPRRTAADNLSYVMYTSGSSGRPKGVMITHRGFCNLLTWTQTVFPLTEAAVVLGKTPFTFSVWELYAPLLVGARLVMARPGGHRDPRYLIDIIRAEKISHLKLVPSLLQAMVAEPGFETCSSLWWVSSGGEPLPRALLERFRVCLNMELVNLYGPTETTHNATFWLSGENAPAGVVPIGRPIANTQAYVLDAQMQPVPVGVPGELYIGGVALARGYLGRPDLTAERFVPNPFSAQPGARMYRTGDLVRYLPNGDLEYLGRLDHQVKLRGFRIELGEIEATLRTRPEVQEATVVLREDLPGGKRLVAYIVPQHGVNLTQDALGQFLRAKLPAYMVPSAFVLLRSLPLTSSGKVDRRGLPPPDPIRPAGPYVAARDDMERQLVQMWEELLGVHPVGVTDNFFELGGHSLLAGRLLARVHGAFLAEISLQVFFAAPTVDDLATTIVETLVEGASVEAVRRALVEVGEQSGEAVEGLRRDARG